MPVKRGLLVVILSLGLSACSSQMRTPTGLDQLRSGQSGPATDQYAQLIVGGDQIDLRSEEAVSDGCLQAWRKELKGDEAGAMKQLRELDKQYPNQSGVRFMMGQVMEHSGKKAEAAKYYRQAHEKQTHSTMYLFKLAESLRTSGNTKAAVPEYRKLISCYPQFVPGKIGLSRALLEGDKKSAEAQEQLSQVLRIEPDNKEAKDLLDQIHSTN